MEQMVEAINLCKEYRQENQRILALDRVNLTAKKGEFIAIMGPSGSGKTTLINILGCLDKPTRGKYYLNGEDTAKIREEKLAVFRRNMIGFIFQSFYLLPNLSAQENIELPLFYNNVARSTRKRISRNLLAQMGLEERAKHLPNQLSGGQRQRVAIARALANDPALILADEPTGNLDEESAQGIMKIFKELHDRGRTILLITHDAKIANCADRVITIQAGHSVCQRGQ